MLAELVGGPRRAERTPRDVAEVVEPHGVTAHWQLIFLCSFVCSFASSCVCFNEQPGSVMKKTKPNPPCHALIPCVEEEEDSSDVFCPRLKSFSSSGSSFAAVRSGVGVVGVR